MHSSRHEHHASGGGVHGHGGGHGSGNHNSHTAVTGGGHSTSEDHHARAHREKEMLYHEKEIWSQRYKLWRKCRVKKPRLPVDEDKNSRWVDWSQNKPLSIATMVGTHNSMCVASLNSVREGFEDSKDLPLVMVISGPSGSGKTTIAQKFIQDLAQDIRLSTAQIPKFAFEIDAGKFESNYTPLWNKISKFVEPVIDRFIQSTFRIVAIDNADLIPPSQQQFLKRIMEMTGKRARWIFVCNDMKKLIAYIQGMALNFGTSSISERNALLVILSLCHRNKIGYDREGIQVLFQMFRDGYSLSKIIDFMQHTFIQYHFISSENISKTAGPGREKPSKLITEVLQPLQRCKICTLFPPCKHITVDEMVATAEKQLAHLPRVKPLMLGMPGNPSTVVALPPSHLNHGVVRCSEFMTFGHCSTFTKYGRCVFDHPRDHFNFIYPARRCTQCTIPWPCNHCEYSGPRKQLLRTIRQIETRLHLLKQLVVPDPLINVAVWLNELFPSWKVAMARYEKKFLTKSMEDGLAATIAWVENSFSQQIEEYRLKDRLISMSFHELLNSPMLDKHALRKAITGEDDDENRDGIDDNGSNEDMLSMSAGSLSVESQVDNTAIIAGAAVGSAEAALRSEHSDPLHSHTHHRPQSRASRASPHPDQTARRGSNT